MIDVITGEPLSYVNIGVVSKGIGTVSNENAYFELNLDGVKTEDIIRISCIGYQALEIKRKDLVGFDEIKEFNLVEIIYDLSEIVVKPKKLKQRVLGNKTRSKVMHVGFDENLLGHEMGVIMKTNERPTWLDSVKFNVSHCGYDSIFFRLNIYEFNEGWPGKNILREPIYISLSKVDVGGTISVDLSDFFIYTEKDFLVSLELVRDLGPGNLYFSTGFFLAPIYYRYTSQDSWKKFGFGAGISAYVTQEKN